jgi:hypothetical protein
VFNALPEIPHKPIRNVPNTTLRCHHPQPTLISVTLKRKKTHDNATHARLLHCSSLALCWAVPNRPNNFNLYSLTSAGSTSPANFLLWYVFPAFFTLDNAEKQSIRSRKNASEYRCEPSSPRQIGQRLSRHQHQLYIGLFMPSTIASARSTDVGAAPSATHQHPPSAHPREIGIEEHISHTSAIPIRETEFA